MCILCALISLKVNKKNLLKHLSIMTKEQLSFIKLVTDVLSEYGIHGEVSFWIACQMALESNFGNSHIAKMKNNICGMRVPHCRLTTSTITIGNDFAKYSDEYACIVDYVLWLQYNHFTQVVICDLERFVKKIASSNYCSDSGYINSINKLFNSLKS